MAHQLSLLVVDDDVDVCTYLEELLSRDGFAVQTVHDPSQAVEALRQGKLYIQIHGEKGVAPDDSNLWGWLLK